MRIDKYFYNQPEKLFVNELKTKVHTSAPDGYGTAKPKVGEVDVSGLYIAEYFPDKEGLLKTAYDDFNLFLRVYKIIGISYPVYLKQGSVLGYESYRIEVNEKYTTVIAEDTEGIRRALIRLEGELVRHEAAILTLGEKVIRPVIKDRITRGFFSPTNRPPKFGDELLDDIDYYPDEYLNRLAHSNTNGLWIYTSFRALISVHPFNNNSEDATKRMNKLKKVVERCKKYGIKVYVFAIEPIGLSDEDAKKHPDMLGAPKVVDWNPVCLRTHLAKEYVINSVESIFRSVPDLGGYIDITVGERPTSCASVAGYDSCPRCSKYSRGENLAFAVDVIKEGIRRAGTGAKFISWTYGHRYWDIDDVVEYAEKAPDDVILMQNFEDGGYNEQLGKRRVAYDYWLSYVGPSKTYISTANRAKSNGKDLWAKMQVCCSHELATVPYIPVPGILYDKYTKAIELGTTGVMECWYFGNYPSIMSRAAGELSFMEDGTTKERFLLDFAASLYGLSKARAIADAWQEFERGYLNYPTNIMFSYYGPMHDGVAWKLSLLPKNLPLPRTWQLTDVPDGDRIGECLFYGHTIQEALQLCKDMCSAWKRGLDVLPLSKKDEQFRISKAIYVLFCSGYNIMRFYYLRSMLGKEQGNAYKIIDEMKSIVKFEISNSKEMIELCNADPRLGYHSEAEGFKFFPEKLSDRIDALTELLNTEFPLVEDRLNQGLAPLSYYHGDANSYKIGTDEVFIGDGRSFKIDKTEVGIVLTVKSLPGDNIKIYYEFELFSPECGIVINEDPDALFLPESVKKIPLGLAPDSNALSHQSVTDENAETFMSAYKLKTERSESTVVHKVYTKVDYDKWNRNTAFKMKIKIGNSSWKVSEDPTCTLGKLEFSPDEFGFVIP